MDDVRVSDHVWSLGRGARSCVVTVVSASPRDVSDYRVRLAAFGLGHRTIEVQRCAEGHEPASRPQRDAAERPSQKESRADIFPHL